MKRYIVLFLLGLLILPVNAQSRKKVGVVLSGGGAKGVAHVGALKVIEEAGIPIDIVVGTSMGAIVGGLYSIGYTPHQMDSMIRKQDWTFLLTDRTQRNQKSFLEKVEAKKYVISLPFIKKPKEVVPDGLVKGQNLHNLFSDLMIGYHDSLDFNKLPLPFACVAVDLMSGKEVVFRNGNLFESMRASMAIPAAFTPVRLDSMVLVDGGLLNNFPVDVARSMGAEIIVGVDVQSGPGEKDKIVTLVDMVNKLTDMTGNEKYIQNLKDTDAYIKVDVKGYNAASFNSVALDTLMARGEVAARNEWDNLNKLKQKIGIDDNFKAPKHGPYVFLSDENPLRIRRISFNGVSKKDAERLKESAEMHENTNLTMNQLHQAIDNLYSLQTYSNITYIISKDGDAYDLEFTLEESIPNAFNLGIRFDSEEIAAVQVNAVYQFKTHLPTKAIVTGRLGKRANVRLDYLLLPSALRSINLSYMFQYTDMNIYDHGSRAYNTTYSQHFADIGYSSILNRNLRMGLGLRYEYYNYNTFLFSNSEHNMTVKPEGFFSYYGVLRYETTDRKSYPTKGMSLQADVSIYTDNLSSYNDNPPFGAACVWWEGAYSLTRRFALLPSFYGRVLFGKDSPYAYLNFMGGDSPGRYMPQQIPFAGVNYVEIFDNSVLVGGLKLRQRMGKNNYVSFKANYALTENDFGRIFDGNQVFGMGLGYGYNSLVGPIEASLNISNRTKKLGFYFNVGYVF